MTGLDINSIVPPLTAHVALMLNLIFITYYIAEGITISVALSFNKLGFDKTDPAKIEEEIIFELFNASFDEVHEFERI